MDEAAVTLYSNHMYFSVHFLIETMKSTVVFTALLLYDNGASVVTTHFDVLDLAFPLNMQNLTCKMHPHRPFYERCSYIIAETQI